LLLLGHARCQFEPSIVAQGGTGDTCVMSDTFIPENVSQGQIVRCNTSISMLSFIQWIQIGIILPKLKSQEK
jgi:hypothetical protein